MSREISTTEALMTDPTTPDGAAYWHERMVIELRREHPPHHDVEGCRLCDILRKARHEA